MKLKKVVRMTTKCTNLGIESFAEPMKSCGHGKKRGSGSVVLRGRQAPNKKVPVVSGEGRRVKGLARTTL